MAAVWPLSQVVAAATDLVLLDLIDEHELALLHDILERYRDGDAYDPFPGSRPRYYDDNAWVGLDFVQRHLTTRAPRALEDAATVLEYVRRGEHPDGGVYWIEEPKQSRHTCSTGPAGELAARLHLLTGDERALAFAHRCATFLSARLRRPDNLYADNVRDDGAIGDAVYSYNQGTPVGLDVLLHEISGDRAFLDRARTAATASLAYFAEDDRQWADSPAFNAVYFRNLLLLDHAEPLPEARRALSRYTERLWTEARDPSSGWFTRGGIGAYDRGGVLDQAGITQLYAMQAMTPAQVRTLC